MPPKLCCCGNCALGTDDFNRADSADPGPKWEILSGTGSIVDNEIVVDGIVATTFCHQPTETLGSFVATFDMIEPTNGDEYIVTAGDPGNWKVRVTFVFTGTPGSGTIKVIIESDGEEIKVGEAVEPYEYTWLADTPVSAMFCYAPGLEATVILYYPDYVETPTSTVCIGEAGTDNCWSATNTDLETVEVGNFAFVYGTFDNFTYEVHWLEIKKCDFCSCFCRLQDEFGVFDYSCVPEQVTITLDGGEVNCSGLSGSYTMYQRLRTDAPEDAPPTSYPYPEKFSWVTNPITCPYSSTTKIAFELQCTGTGKDDIDTVPQFNLYCIQWNTAAARGSNIGFDPADPDTIETASQAAFDNVSYGVCKAGTCNPLYMEFPDLIEDNYNSDEGNACCDGAINSGGSYQPSYRWSVVVTA